jgi:hypothetical protein
VQGQLPLPEDIAKEQEAVRAYGGNYDILLEQISLIEAHLNRLQLPQASEETARILIRHLAVTQLLYRVESLYRGIFGSQISVLKILNERGPQLEIALRPLFEKARRRSPRFYGEYSFDDWIGFLLKQGCVLKKSEDGAYAITIFGQRFLEFLIYIKAPKKLH